MYSQNEKKYAPVILFVYSRASHTQEVLDSLKKNTLSIETDLIIYSDAPKSDIDKHEVDKVRKIIKAAQGFKTVKIICREKNFGLAKNIIEGVTETIRVYGKVIVLEDDIVTSPQFLEFMNSTLDKYQNEKKVWHISGWNYPIEKNGIGDAFFWRLMNCWGWATWADRWQNFEKNPQELINQWDKKKIKRFNLDGVNNCWNQVIDNQLGRINTWAVFWYATIFTANGLCLNVTHTLVKNIGFDGTGEHCSNVDIYNSPLASNRILALPTVLKENSIAVDKIKKFYLLQKPKLIIRIFNKLKRWLLQ